MTFGFLFATTSIVLVSLYCAIEIYDFIMVKKGIFPPKENTSLDDIKAMKKRGYSNMALRRFMRMPSNKGIYTLKGAKIQVDAL